MSILVSIDDMMVMDAKSSLKIIVSPDDVKKANVKEPDACAFARGCMHNKSIEEVRVHLGRVYVRNKGAKHWLRYITPPALRAEIIAFDRGGKFLPGEFTIYAPQPKKRLVADKRKRPSHPKRTGKPRKPRQVIRDVRGGPI